MALIGAMINVVFLTRASTAWRNLAVRPFLNPAAFERSRCRGGRFAWFDRAIAMSQNKIGVSRRMSIEYPYKQLPCQTQGGFLQTTLSAVTRPQRSCSVLGPSAPGHSR